MTPEKGPLCARTIFAASHTWFIVSGLFGLWAASLWAAGTLRAAEPAPGEQAVQRPTTVYVSKLGDNTDGSTWQKAFHTIQAALEAVPDDQGGHQIIVRPDTYVEANLAPAHKARPVPTTR